MDVNSFFFDAVHQPFVSVRALIVRDDQLLVTVNSDINEEFFLLPGGRHQHGLPLPESLRRGVQEEICCDVEVGDLACVRDYIGANHEFAEWDAEYHQLDVIFWATLPEDAEPRMGDNDATYQTGVRWLPLDTLADQLVFPSGLKTWFPMAPLERPLYLGDNN